MFPLQSDLNSCLSKPIMKRAATASLSKSSSKQQALKAHHHAGSPQGKLIQRLSVTLDFTVAPPLTFLYSSNRRLPGPLASALPDSVAIAIVPMHCQLAEVPGIVKSTN